MWLGVLAAGVAALIGAGLALARVPAVVLHGIRVLALCSMVPAVMLDVLPEATLAMGPFALVLFALAFFVPSLAAHYAPTRSTTSVLTAAFAALVIHKLLDGFALGTVTGHDEHVHWNVVVAVAAHTIPMMCAMGIAFAPFGSRGVWLRALAVAAAIAIGALAGDAGAASLGTAAPALNAIAAGLLFHLLLHDLHPPRRTPKVKLAELAGALAGLGLVWLTMSGDAHGNAHGHAEAAAHAHEGVQLAVWDIATMVAPWLALGLLLRTASHAVQARWPALTAARAMTLWETAAPARCDTASLPPSRDASGLSRWTYALMFPFVAVEMMGFAFFAGLWWHVAFVGAAAASAAVVALLASAWVRRYGAAPHKHGHRHSHGHDHGEAHGHSHDHKHGHDHASAAPALSTWRFAVEAMAHDAGRISLGLLLAILVLISDHHGTWATLGCIIGAAVAGILFAPMWWVALGTTLVAAPWLAITALALMLAYRAYLATPTHLGAKRFALAAVAALTWLALMAMVPTLLASLEPTTVLVSKLATTDWRVTLAPWVTWASVGVLAALVSTSAWTHGLASWLAGLHNHPHRDVGDHWQEQ
ncbi:MAG: hypothetical protein IPL79_15600 [Myxococcales bacterium]|nr:hypothetical protein [Myxococcales bacterium]